MHVLAYILKRLPPLPPTSGTRGLDAWMLGGLDAFLGTLGLHLATLGLHLGTLGLHLGTLGLHLATHGVHFPTLCPLWGGALEPLTHLMKKASKKVPN